MRETVGTAALRIVGAVMLLGGLATVIVPRPGFTPVNQWVVLPVCAVVLALVLLVRVPARLRANLGSPWAGPVLAVVGGGVGAFLGEMLHYPFGWDARVIISLSRQLQAGGPLSSWAYHYLSMYPNNMPLLAIDRVAAAVGARLGVMPDSLLIGLNAVALLASIWFVHLLVRRCAGPVAAALAAVLVTVFVGLSPWMAVPYTDIFGMPFTIGAIGFASLAWFGRGLWRWLAWAAAVLSAAVAYVIKTTPVVLIVAGVLVILLGLLPSREGTGPRPPAGMVIRRVARVTAVAGLTALVFVGAVAGITTIAWHGTKAHLGRVHTSASAPAIWWIANGMIEVPAKTYISYGGYSRTMVKAIDGRTQPEMTAYSRQFIADRWAERGLPGMVEFYASKAVWNWGDGTFTAWGEGGDAQKHPYAEGAVSDALMEFTGYHSPYYETRASITEGVWAAVVLLAGIGLLRARFRRDLLLLALSTLGIGLFVLAFQGRARYLLTFVPVVIALSCAVLPWARMRPSRTLSRSGR